MASLLYVTRSVIAPDDTATAVRAIVAVAQSRNADLNVTGALLFTGSHFAQILEGKAEAIGLLLASIRRDPRHRDIVVVDRHAPKCGVSLTGVWHIPVLRNSYRATSGVCSPSH